MRWTNWWRSFRASLGLSLKRSALLLLKVYRTFLSPWLAPACRFQPSCSAYAEEAMRLHPPARALWLTVRRLAKCHPLGPYGFDPVPERKTL